MNHFVDSSHDTRSMASPWARAETFADVCELTARWLEGRISTRPSYTPNCGPDPETHKFGLTGALAWLNRSSYLTDNSQPGHDYLPDGMGHWRQRASVTGWLRDDLMHDTVSRLARDGLVVITPRGAHNAQGLVNREGRIPVTELVERPRWWASPKPPRTMAGLHVSPLAHQRQAALDLCRPETNDHINASATLLHVIDPQWGDNQRLWRSLHATLSESLAQKAAAKASGANHGDERAAERAREIAERAKQRNAHGQRRGMAR